MKTIRRWPTHRIDSPAFRTFRAITVMLRHSPSRHPKELRATNRVPSHTAPCAASDAAYHAAPHGLPFTIEIGPDSKIGPRRFKSFPIQEDEHFYAVARYVERNALRANFVRRAEEWSWCSLYRWLHGAGDDKPLLSSWPVPRKAGWVEHVNAPQSEAELAAIRRSVERGSPFGSESWNERAIRRLGLESTLRPRGRPRKQAGKGS